MYVSFHEWNIIIFFLIQPVCITINYPYLSGKLQSILLTANPAAAMAAAAARAAKPDAIAAVTVVHQQQDVQDTPDQRRCDDYFTSLAPAT